MKSLNFIRFTSLLILWIICAAQANAQNWPQYLGPERNSTSPKKNLLRSWPESGPEVLWTVEVGKGYGGPVVHAGRVYCVKVAE